MEIKKMKIKIFSNLLFMLLIVINYNYASSESKAICNIEKGSIQKFFNSDSFIIKFSNIIYEHKGKKIRIPIFRGSMGDVAYDDFRKFCSVNNLLEEGFRESGFIIKTDKGKLSKTFNEFLLFYKKSILSNTDLNKPSRIEVDGGGLYLFYEFNIEGVPCVIYIVATTKEEYKSADQIKSITGIELDETAKIPHFRYSFWINYKSEEIPVL